MVVRHAESRALSRRRPRVASSTRMTAQGDAREFFDAYRAAFEALAPAAIADLFAYPCHITSDAEGVELLSVANREQWARVLERLVAAYRAIGVRAAEVLDLHAVELTPRLAQVRVRWRLADDAGRPIYDFDAAYTLAEFGDARRITAIAHDERAHLEDALRRRSPARGSG